MEREPQAVIVDVYCSKHGHIGKMSPNNIRDMVSAHREKEQCNGQMTVDIESPQQVKSDNSEDFND